MNNNQGKQSQQENQGKKNDNGLTKKERRALKVQEKHSNVKTKDEAICKSPKSSEKDAKLTEKEQRRLEWEKKLAIQKTIEGNKGLSETQLRSQRREQQEAQRQAKVAKNQPKKIEEKIVITKKSMKKKDITNKVHLVNHLYVENLNVSKQQTIVNIKNIHPAFVKLGVQYSAKTVLGSNARCLSLLLAVKRLIHDCSAPPKQEFCRFLEHSLKNCVDYLQTYRPFAVSMTNALRYFKLQLTQEAGKLPEIEKKNYLLNVIDTYITDQVNKAGEAISLKVNDKISKCGDVILTFGCSSLIRKILLDAHMKGKQFKVIIVDGRPFLEGRQMLRRLIKDEIECIYVQMNALNYVMGIATKVLLGAHALLANGYVMSRIGTAQVALMAHAHNKPVLVCCETYKFSERVQTDSFVYNEIGKNDLLLDDLNQMRCVLNLLYDVTPSDFVTAVVTELAILPCTSVPVVLRIKPTELF